MITRSKHRCKYLQRSITDSAIVEDRSCHRQLRNALQVLALANHRLGGYIVSGSITSPHFVQIVLQVLALANHHLGDCGRSITLPKRAASTCTVQSSAWRFKPPQSRCKYLQRRMSAFGHRMDDGEALNLCAHKHLKRPGWHCAKTQQHWPASTCTRSRSFSATGRQTHCLTVTQRRDRFGFASRYA